MSPAIHREKGTHRWFNGSLHSDERTVCWLQQLKWNKLTFHWGQQAPSYSFLTAAVDSLLLGFRVASFPAPVPQCKPTLMKAMLYIFLFCCSSVFADEGEIRVFSIAHTNADNWVYNKDEFTRDGQTNLVRILKIVPQQGWVRVCRFYHDGEAVGNFVVREGETLFNTEAGVYSMSLKYGAAGELLSARIGDKRGVLLDEFAYTNGTFSPVAGPLKRQVMKPLFYDEAKFIKEAAEAEARLKKQATEKDSPSQ